MNKLILGNNIDILPTLGNNSVDLCITSPPYKDEDGYSVLQLRTCFDMLYNVLKDDSLFFLNFGHLASNKFRPFSTCELALAAGFKLNDTIIWIKNHYKPIQGHKRLNNLTEFIFVLYKGKMPKLNRLSIGVPYKDKSNVKRFSGGNDLKCGGNVWYINYPTINKTDQKLHHDRYPVELPEKCIRLCGYNVETVLDPFCGSGTTCVAAKKLGKKYIGIEINSIYYDAAKSRLEQ